jgi:hypothetical protein
MQDENNSVADVICCIQTILIVCRSKNYLHPETLWWHVGSSVDTLEAVLVML